MNIEKKIADLRVVFNNLIELIEADLREQDKKQNEHIRKYKEHPYGDNKEIRELSYFTFVTKNRLKTLVDLITEISNKKKVVPNENEKKIADVVYDNFLGGSIY